MRQRPVCEQVATSGDAEALCAAEQGMVLLKVLGTSKAPRHAKTGSGKHANPRHISSLPQNFAGGGGGRFDQGLEFSKL